VHSLDKEVFDIIKKHWSKIKKKENVVGHSGNLVPRWVDGKEEEGTKVVRVYVQEKKPKSQLREKDVIPDKLEGEEVDVFYLGGIPKAQGQYEDEVKGRFRPIPCGVSAMGVWRNSTACTQGGFAKNKKRGEEEFIGMLANNHCCANENKAIPGIKYIQPSPYDGGSYNHDAVALLHRFVELGFESFSCPYRNAAHSIYRALNGETKPNLVDIGLLKPIEGIVIDLDVYKVGMLKGKREAIYHDKVAKVGRTTGLTDHGKVIDVDFNGNVSYSRGTIPFTDCVLVYGNKFSQGGDSSSLTFTVNGDSEELADRDLNIIGNLFAGTNITSIICKQSNVEKLLEVEYFY